MPTRLVCFFGVLAAFAVSTGARAETVPSETLVSLQPDLIDLEFSQSRSQFVWADSKGSLWVGNIDRQTGRFVPASGKAILVDSDALTTVDLGFTFNGPEWVPSIQGEQIVYTKFLPVYPHYAFTARLALAQEAPDGSWSFSVLGPDLPRIGPYGSSDADDPSPRITYMDRIGRHYWRELWDESSERRIPLLPPSVKSVRFAQGDRSLIFSKPIDGTSQVFRHHLDSGVVEQLTFDAGDKDIQTVPWMWRAPEFGYDLVFMTVVDNAELRIYRKVDVGNGVMQWAPVFSLAFPAGHRIASPEPFTHNGQSYIYMVMTDESIGFPSSVWLTNIDAAAPMFVKVSDDSLLRVRTDPEVFITDRGPYIYYNRYNQNVDPEHPYCAACSEGIFRAYTGLPPPQ